MFIKHPDNNKESVSLTLLLISFGLLSIAGILQCFSIIKDVGPFMEIFIICTSLYFGQHHLLNLIKGYSSK